VYAADALEVLTLEGQLVKEMTAFRMPHLFPLRPTAAAVALTDIVPSAPFMDGYWIRSSCAAMRMSMTPHHSA
jgi:hypothetical protein